MSFGFKGLNFFIANTIVYCTYHIAQPEQLFFLVFCYIPYQQVFQTNMIGVGFGVLTAASMKMAFFWVSAV
jgi:hypothetical protein